MKVALLTGGKDPHYAHGLLRQLAARSVRIALIGGDESAEAEAVRNGQVEFHNLVGRPDPDDGLMAKARRVLSYYGRLLVFAARTDGKVFHILWFRKFPLGERILLIAYFKLLGKKLAFTAHNVDDQRQQLGLGPDEKVLLFFGNIAPYKGVEDLLRALASLVHADGRFTLILAGRVKDRTCEAYWAELESLIEELQLSEHVRKEIRYIPDGHVGLLFRASDVSVLPYRRIYQSGVLALSYAQGVPVIAADVGSIREDILEDETGLLFRPGDVVDLAAKIRTYFVSESFKDVETRERRISEYGAERFSWETNAERTHAVYEHLLESSPLSPTNSLTEKGRHQ